VKHAGFASRDDRVDKHYDVGFLQDIEEVHAGLRHLQESAPEAAYRTQAPDDLDTGAIISRHSIATSDYQGAWNRDSVPSSMFKSAPQCPVPPVLAIFTCRKCVEQEIHGS